jgi:hypothetical protein
VTIPTGYHWVKVWAFRGTLAPRSYVKGGQEISKTGSIACHAEYSDGSRVFTACENTGHSLQDIVFNSSSPTTSTLAQRVIGNTSGSNNYVCARFPAANAVAGQSITNGHPGQAPCNDTALCGVGGPPNEPALGDFLPGMDLWERSKGTGPNKGTLNLDDSSVDFTPGDHDDNFEDNEQDVPHDAVITEQDLDSNQARYDYVFVVTPTTVMKSTLENQLAGSEPYIPFTYKRAEDCSSLNPDSDATCIANAARKTIYGLWTGPITDGSDASAGTQTYPVCALQPN